jgi:hypothetical protein
MEEQIMRAFLLAAIAVATFSFGATISPAPAGAVVCARGVVRAGCASARGAVVVHRPVAACRWVVVNGVRVRRCV